MDRLSISDLKRHAQAAPVEGRVWAQIESLARKETREGKPFWELGLADAAGKLTLRAWSDAPAFAFCESAAGGCFVEVTGGFANNGGYGLDAKRWNARELTLAERDELLAGSSETSAKQNADFEFIVQRVAAIADPRLRGISELFLAEHGPRFRRAAAARGNHHARRGGLVEHTAQMLRAALALAGAYPSLNAGLLTAGVLFHDCGKLWENALPADGFAMPFDERGELLGHITIGIELVNKLWPKLLVTPAAAEWTTLTPSSEDVRLHLLHLIAAHHGSLEFGSPVPPKTPEAWVLHYVDNLDAKMEMLAAGYASARQLAPRIQERVWPLPGNLVTPLAHFSEPSGEAPSEAERVK